MIDSSGHRALHANGTVLDLLPIGQSITILGALLITLFVLIKPEASNGLDIAGRVVFWTLHVGLGLVALRVSSHWLASRQRLPSGTLAAVLVTGCAAVVIAAPGYLALDALFTAHLVDLDAEPTDEPFFMPLVGEMMNLAPWFLTTWVVINLPVLLPRPTVSVLLDDEAQHDDPASSALTTLSCVRSNSSDSHGRIVAAPSVILVDDAATNVTPTPQINVKGERFLSSLPGIVGTDVIAVSSDLHYLNVWTLTGRTTVLGNLKDVVIDLGDAGMQVHRSHWVAHAHVRRIVGTASDAACILSNELRVPISRRRWKAIREQYGRGVVHNVRAARQADTKSGSK